MKKKDVKKMIEEAIDKHSSVASEGLFGSPWSWHKNHQDVSGNIDQIWEAVHQIEDYLGVELKCTPKVCKLVKKRSRKHDKKDNKA